MSVTILGFMAVGLSLIMVGAWYAQQRTGNSGWIDTIWSAAVGLGSLFAIAFSTDGDLTRRLVLAAAVALWSLRLASHIGFRSAGAKEDPRYEALAKEWGDIASSRLFWFLQIQALVAFVLALAVYSASVIAAPFGSVLDLLAVITFVAALGGEALSDAQLSRFRKEKHAKGSVCDIGLWGYSRHPNYFFEWLFWCGFAIAALGALFANPLLSALALLAPLMMYWLLVHVSGIPPLEEHMLRSRGEAFRQYQNRVNAFFPGPRHSANVKEVAQ